ncbi:MAG: aminopeptidase P family protein [Desulfamplus sp.]|nr:aminopeptidase P family protein [Desulfamplus sp.]
METYHRITPKSEIDQRVLSFQKRLSQQDIDGALILQKTDFFYFTGTFQQGWLYIPATGGPLLMIFKDFERARAESPMDEIISVSGAGKVPEALTDMGYPVPKKLGMELDVLPVNLYFQYKKIFKLAEISDISTDIRMLRAVKSDHELACIGEAAKMSDLVAAKAMELIRPGKSEVTLAGELEAYARSLGHQGNVRMRLWGAELFYGHILSGKSAAVPSYLASPTGGYGTSPATAQGAGFKELQPNEPILVDYVAALNGYLSDHARIFSIGSLSQDLMDAHHAMLDVQEMAKEIGRPGMVCEELYNRMVEQASMAGYGEWFMGATDRRIRFTGHGIGLELDEFPFIAKGQKLVLEEGMVIALEPKLIIPGKGVVGIENSFVVTKDGLAALGKFPDGVSQC